jgi:putative ABC transport system substrate-binding protein
MVTDLVGKRLELLKEAFPNVTRVAVLWYPANPAHPQALQEVQVAARALGLLVQELPVRREGDFDRAFASMRRARADAVFILGDKFIELHRRRIADLAIKHRLPSMFGYRLFVDAGGLMSYGADLPDMYRRSAIYVDKILKGAKPADLPVEQPTQFEFVISLKTAKALGLTIPQSVLVRADEVIK